VLLWPLVNRFVLRRSRRPALTEPATTGGEPPAAPPPGAEDRPRVPADGPGTGSAGTPPPDERPPDRDRERP
jgi:hypothetical protein